MNISAYNLYIPINSQDFILYNTLNNIFILIDSELKDALETGNLEEIGRDDRERLRAYGIILKDCTNEKNIINYRYNSLKFSSSYSTFVIFPTYKCNLSCHYCYQKAANLSGISMDKKAVDRTVGFIQAKTGENRSKNLVIKLFGGEPLLNSRACIDISERLFEWSKRNNINYIGTLTTNGTLFSGRIFEKLAPYICAVHITLDGPRDLHNKKRFYRNGKGTYDDVLKAVSLIKDCGKYLTLRINLYEEKLQFLYELLNDIDKTGIGGNEKLIFDFGLVVPDSCGLKCDDESYVKNKAKYLELLPKVREIMKKTGWEQKAYFTYADDIGKGLAPMCEHLKPGNYVIDPSCDLFLCPSTALDKRFKIGKIRDDGVAWKSVYYEIHTRDPLDFEECRNCIYLPMCGGGCPVHAYKKKGTHHAPYCGINKEFTASRVLSYLRSWHPEKFEDKFYEKLNI